MHRTDEWFERLYERHHRAVAAYCLRRVPAADAADATAQVFTVAWQRGDDVPDGDGQLPWLYGVARRVVSHHWRGAGRARRLVRKAAAIRPVPPAGPDALAVDDDDHRLVRDAVMSLGEQDREVLLLSAWEGLTHRQIADVIGCSVAAVDKRAARAKARLAERYRSMAGSSDPSAEPVVTRSPVRARKGGGGR